MLELLRHIVYVSLSLRGPDSLPGSQALLALCLLPWAALSIVSNLLVLSSYPGAALLGVVLELALLLGYVWLLLQLAGKPERLAQTLAALLGVQAVIVAASLPLTWLSASLEEPSAILQASEFAFVAWWLVAAANILSRAVDRSLISGVLLSLAHFVLYLMAYALMFEFLGVDLPEA